MRVSSLGLALSVVAMVGASALAACGVFGRYGSDSAPVDAATEADTDAGLGPDADDGAPPCDEVAEPATIEADTYFTLASCDTPASHGAATNLSASTTFLTLVRFNWSANAEAAAVAGRLVSLSLVIDENPTCNGTCGTNNHVLGTFSVHPARTDWDEGTSAAYSGADGCRRTTGTDGGTGKGWGLGNVVASASTKLAAGVDYGASSIADFTLASGGSRLSFVVPGASALFSTRTARKIAFLVVGGPNTWFYGASKESVIHPAPSLVVTYCK